MLNLECTLSFFYKESVCYTGLEVLDSYTLEDEEFKNENALWEIFRGQENNPKANVASLSFKLSGPLAFTKGTLNLVWFKRNGHLWSVCPFQWL